MWLLCNAQLPLEIVANFALNLADLLMYAPCCANLRGAHFVVYILNVAGGRKDCGKRAI